MTITNQQVKLFMKNSIKMSQKLAAAKAGMDVKTARKYMRSGELPSDVKIGGRRKPRANPFESHWKELTDMLNHAPGLEAKTLLSYLLKKYPDLYDKSQLRNLQRRVRSWRAEHGASKLIIFRQHIQPGKQSQSDCTWMNSLNITLINQPFNHLLFHFMLPYSCWESVSICLSENFESLVKGYEKAVWELGYVAPEHRTDNLTAATQAMGSHREFTERWKQFMQHYDVKPTTNNPGISHENGSVEKSHDTLKKAINQALLLRGSRNFDTLLDYQSFLEKVVASRNEDRRKALIEEITYLKDLPQKKWHSPKVIRARVSACSVIHLLGKPYSVPSRLIHYTLTAYIYPEEILLFYNHKIIQRMLRQEENRLSGINYRHLIDGLVRKPSAFSGYRYHEAFFPRLCFRRAYDFLKRHHPVEADKWYLKLLQLAKMESEQAVSEALEVLWGKNELPTVEAVKIILGSHRKEIFDVTVDEPNLTDYDTLLSIYH